MRSVSVGPRLDVLFIRVKLEGLLIHHLLQNFLSRLKIVPGPIERLLALGLGFLIVETLEVGMVKALLDCVTFLWVEY
jgi:hypothetical protein